MPKTKPIAAGPVFYDIEASSLDGYPIEVGWAQVTSALAIESEGHLIHHSGWNLSARWSKRAESIHHIPMAEVKTRGEPPYKIANRMNAALAGRELFADSAYDENWLRLMFDAAGFEPVFTIRRMLADLLIAQRAAAVSIPAEVFKVLLAKAGDTIPRTHRAEQDARHLAAQWLAVIQLQLRAKG